MEKLDFELKTIAVALLASVSSLCNVSAQETENVEWPNFPVFNIKTVNSEMPTATKVYPPEGAVGESIISEYVSGHLVITLKGDTLYDSGDYVKEKSGMRIKIRGNSTGANLEQHPYKIKLTKKADLLLQNDEYKNKNWALLSMNTWNTAMKNAQSNILTRTGLAVCAALDFPWEPRTRFVNLVLNGEYQGMYNLIETVERDESRVNIGKKGFIIENDAYWWKEGEVYFKTDRQHSYMGYTFKYPDADDVDDSYKASVQAYMNMVEAAAFSSETAAAYIDYDSFARWMLAHDILGDTDSAGSNIFLCKDDFKANNPTSSKLKMSTLWDFDASFKAGEGQWSTQHYTDVLHFSQLFKDEAFVDKYVELYNEYKDKVYPYMENYFNELKAQDGEAFEQSRELHRKVYKNDCPNSLDEQIDDVLTHLKERMQTLETLVNDLVTGVETATTDSNARLVSRVNVLGIDCTHADMGSLPKGVYIEKYSNGEIKKVFNK